MRGPCFSSPILVEVNYQPESRMRENRLSGSEGGGAYALPTPIPLAPGCIFLNRRSDFSRFATFALIRG